LNHNEAPLLVCSDRNLPDCTRGVLHTPPQHHRSGPRREAVRKLRRRRKLRRWCTSRQRNSFDRCHHRGHTPFSVMPDSFAENRNVRTLVAVLLCVKDLVNDCVPEKKLGELLSAHPREVLSSWFWRKQSLARARWSCWLPWIAFDFYSGFVRTASLHGYLARNLLYGGVKGSHVGWSPWPPWHTL